MASPTVKIKKIRKAKITKSGARRKRDIRHEERAKIAKVAELLGLKIEA